MVILEALFVAGVQSTIVLLVTLLACQLLVQAPSVRLVICRTSFVATAAILLGSPWLHCPPRPLVPQSWLVPGFRMPRPQIVRAARGSTSNPAATTLEGYPSDPVSREVALPSLDVLAPLCGIWVAGVLVLGTWIALGYWKLADLRRNSKPVSKGVILQAVSQASLDFGILAPEVRESNCPSTPFVTGIWRPTLYVPGCWPEGMDRDVLEGICRHEVAHLIARDLHWQIAYRITTILFWPQVLLWGVSRQATIASEELCDRRVLASGCSAHRYAMSLLLLKESMATSRSVGPIGIGAVSIRSAFGKRIEAIMSSPKNVRSELSRSGLLGLILGCSLVAGLTSILVAAPVVDGASSSDAATGGLKRQEKNVSKPVVSSSTNITKATGWKAIADEGPDFPMGQNVDGFILGKDSSVTHNGKASGVIQAAGVSQSAFRSLAQYFRADTYRGKRIRLTAYVKTKDLTGGAMLWMRVDGMGGELAFDNMANRPILGTTDWTPYSIVLDVPEDAVAILFGSGMIGAGTTWVDDYSIQKVDPAKVATTVSSERPSGEGDPVRPQNLDFSASPKSVQLDIPGWIDSSGPWKSAHLDVVRKRDGKPTATLVNSGNGEESLFQEIKASDFRGKRIEFQAYLRSSGNVVGGTFVAIPGGGQWLHASIGSSPKSGAGNQDWKPILAVLDVPKWATLIQFGFELTGPGQIWASDCSLKVVDPKKVPVTEDFNSDPSFSQAELDQLPMAPVNLDFER